MNKLCSHYIWCVAAHVCVSFHGTMDIQLLIFYNISNFDVYILHNICVIFNICLLHIRACDHRFMLCNAGVFTSGFVSMDGQRF